MALSAPVPYAESLMAEVHPANAAVPLFIAHGTDDRVVPYDLVQQAHQRMEARGLKLERHTYVMGHTLVPDEIRDIAAWLTRVLAGQGG
jgi:phospholipase/carboxylesterase